MEKLIWHNWFFEYPVETMWEYLTKSELIAGWLMANNFRPEPGCQFTFKSNATMDMHFDGNVYCEVLEVVPFKKLVYSWKFGPGGGRIDVDSLVAWTLFPNDEGSELHLIHSGIDEEKNTLAYQVMNSGWDIHVRERMGNLIRSTLHRF